MIDKRIALYYEKNRKRILAKVSRRVGKDDAEDVVQEIFIKIMKYHPTFDRRKSKFPTWVNHITNNCIKDCLKERQKRQGFMFSSSYIIGPDKEPRYEDNTAETQQEIERLLNKIKGRGHPARSIIYLNYVLGYLPTEISEKLNLDPKIVRNCVYRFKKEINV